MKIKHSLCKNTQFNPKMMHFLCRNHPINRKSRIFSSKISHVT
ncbi:hypothetical protein CP8484711_2978 [Chlamydia psittaci 84-8471/1]|nr:hypothetical protein CP082626L3_1467 [Chlamydia psittaci 08-2626_L3]EPP36389.1 hypothetical protein CP8484711_2978 [Chlamydia psittaci 84-8471/1]